MEKYELKKWFINKWNSCYEVKYDNYPDHIFLYYDKNAIRKIKLCKLNNIEFKQDKVTGVCLFKHDFKDDFLWCNYKEIWSFFEHNYSNNYTEIREFISCILKEQDNFNILKPYNGNNIQRSKLLKNNRISDSWLL